MCEECLEYSVRDVLGAAAARKQPARNVSEQQVTVLRRVLKLTVKAAEAMSKGAVNFLGGNARSVPVHALANGAIVPACATRSGLSSPATGSRASDKIVSLPLMTVRLSQHSSLCIVNSRRQPEFSHVQGPLNAPRLLHFCESCSEAV